MGQDWRVIGKGHMLEGQGLIDQCQRRLDLCLLTPSRCWWGPQTGSPAPQPAGPSAHLKPAPSSDAASVGSCCSPGQGKETGLVPACNLLLISCPHLHSQGDRIPGISWRHTRAQAPNPSGADQDTEPWPGPRCTCAAQGDWVVTCLRRSESCSSSFCPASSSLTSEYVSLMMARNMFWRRKQGPESSLPDPLTASSPQTLWTSQHVFQKGQYLQRHLCSPLIPTSQGPQGPGFQHSSVVGVGVGVMPLHQPDVLPYCCSNLATKIPQHTPQAPFMEGSACHWSQKLSKVRIKLCSLHHLSPNPYLYPCPPIK